MAKSKRKSRKSAALAKILSAKACNKNYIQIVLSANDLALTRQDVRVDVDVRISKVRVDGVKVLIETSDLDYRGNYFVHVKGYDKKPVDMSALLDEVYSNKPLGFTFENNHTVFRLFAPRATSVRLVIFENYADRTGLEHEMESADDGVWEYALAGEYWGKYYGYKVAGPNGPTELFQPDQILADPYSKAVVSKNSYLHEAKSIITRTDDYRWEGDTFLDVRWEDLIIYEMHVRDMTVHPSARVEKKGTYRGLIEESAIGGLSHVLDLGVNAVELLPCQEFGKMEWPYNERVNGTVNTWNPYARNHWGYMTSYFFAPESYYASGGNLTPGDYRGVRGQQQNEFKDMIKAFHKSGLAVIMDVVYNHVSHYDWNPIKYVDKKYYFRLDSEMKFLSTSGCGNDFKTERPMARRLILDSIKYWLEEYHVDGFRFDLATMIDWETIEQIRDEARKINPNVILIAEPWGGGQYDLAGFSQRGWAAWNDLFRNGVKGGNAENGQGWIFGKVWGQDNLDSIKFYNRSSVREYGGPFLAKSHSVNYLESHDDLTLGDFIRIGVGDVSPREPVADPYLNAQLNERQMRINKLAALFLLTSQGQVMISEGQEFARSKVIASTDAPEIHIGFIDHNSYNKDNETNWLNFEHKTLNQELFDYYRGLIQIRMAYPALRRSPLDAIQFLSESSQLSLGFVLPRERSSDGCTVVVLLNSDPHRDAHYNLPSGKWRTIVDERHAGTEPFGEAVEGQTLVPARSGMVLVEVK